MAEKKETALARGSARRDPFGLLRQMTSELDRVFEQPFGSAFRWPSLRAFELAERESWAPQIDVFERDNRLVTKVDLPGIRKEDVKVEVTDGYLTISGERKSEVEEEKDDFYRCERGYGHFYRAVPLPEGVKVDDIKATFSEGVLEVSVPLPAKTATDVQTIAIEDAGTPTKAA